MHLAGDYKFKATRQSVWDTLLSPDAIARSMPGCEDFKQVGEDEYEATMRAGIGAIKGTFHGRIHLADRNNLTSYRMDVEGGGGPGRVKGSGLITLAESDGQTVVSYDGDAQVVGLIASVGQRLLGVTARKMIEQFFKSMEKQIAPA